jgi:hypothetical protein
MFTVEWRDSIGNMRRLMFHTLADAERWYRNLPSWACPSFVQAPEQDNPIAIWGQKPRTTGD